MNWYLNHLFVTTSVTKLVMSSFWYIATVCTIGILKRGFTVLNGGFRCGLEVAGHLMVTLGSNYCGLLGCRSLVKQSLNDI